MKVILLVLFLNCVAIGSKSQDSAPFNKIDVKVINPLHFLFNNATDLLLPKTINNAIELAIKIKQENTNVFAHLGYSNQGITALPLALRLASTSSSNSSVPANTINLYASPTLLFSQPASAQGTKHYSFFYDVILTPSSEIIPPGNYNFSIHFTITPE